ncbi:MAG: hypothetical protein Kow0074_22550 [Candidatus Zixiibacteriota bacterium]
MEAVRWAVAELDAEIVSSTHPLTWDLVTWTAAQNHATVHLFQPESDADPSRLTHEFQIPQERLRIQRLNVRTTRSGKAWWIDRDRAIVEFADILIPVSVRRGGALEELLARHAGRKDIISRFRTTYSPAAHHERYPVDRKKLNPKLKSWPKGFLIHWTRSCHGPWPGETMADFLGDLTASQITYCRSALRTLTRILSEQRLRGSSWHIGAHQPVVALTELSPLESIPLMRWRPRWARWSFEPFGIAIPVAVAESLGARPVRYVTPEKWRSVPDDEKPFTHSIGKEDAIWPAEREWRVAGDLPLDSISCDAGIIIVRDTGSLRQLEDKSGWRTVRMMIS